jgi:hypothetical protein
MAGKAVNKFQDVLATIKGLEENQQDREAVLALGEKYPELRDGWLRQSDYSKKMDEVSAQNKEWESKVARYEEEMEELPKLKEFQAQMSEWWKENWEPEAYGKDEKGNPLGATKRELKKDELLAEQTSRIEELQKQIDSGEDMNFDEITKYLNGEIEKRGFVSQDTLNKRFSEGEAGVKDLMSKTTEGLSHLVTKGPKIAVRHFREFQEDLEINDVVDFATKNGFNDLEKAYESFVSPKMKEREQAARVAEIEAAKKEARDQALKEVGMNPEKPGLVNDEPEMSSFQRFVAGGKSKEESVVPDDVPFNGKGLISQHAAANWDKRGASGDRA